MESEQQTPKSNGIGSQGKQSLKLAAFEFALIPIAGLLGAWLGCSPVRSIAEGAAGWSDDVFAITCGVGAAFPPLAGLWWMQRTTMPPFRELQTLVDRLVAPLFIHCTRLELALVALVAGLGEELLFRGVLQDALAGWCGERWGDRAGIATAIIFTSLGFGLLHSLSRTYFVLATAMSVYLGALHAAVGNVLAPVAAHAVYDFVALAYFIPAPEAAERTNVGNKEP